MACHDGGEALAYCAMEKIYQESAPDMHQAWWIVLIGVPLIAISLGAFFILRPNALSPTASSVALKAIMPVAMPASTTLPSLPDNAEAAKLRAENQKLVGELVIARQAKASTVAAVADHEYDTYTEYCDELLEALDKVHADGLARISRERRNADVVALDVALEKWKRHQRKSWTYLSARELDNAASNYHEAAFYGSLADELTDDSLKYGLTDDLKKQIDDNDAKKYDFRTKAITQLFQAKKLLSEGK